MAQRIQLKRSSIPGKRPDSSYLSAGELALNTNAVDPGLFFEVNTGAIAKVGPTAVSTNAPATEVGWGQGETWLDTGNDTFKVYSTAAQKWITAQSPTFSGSEKLIFVGTNFPEATDDLSNDGGARPFATLNRAVIEVARRSILQSRSDDVYNDKFVIMLLPGDNTVLNDPGVSTQTFIADVNPFQADQALPLSTLRLFNPEEGGLLLPRGTSIVGFDLRKTVIRPTYKPFWSLEAVTAGGGDIEPRTSTVKWSGNSFASSLTFKDKKSANSVTAITGGFGEVAVCTTLEPHGFRALTMVEGSVSKADIVKLTYPQNVARTFQTPVEVVSTVAEGDFYVNPLTPTTFSLLKLDGSALLREDLPGEPGAGTDPPEFFRLTYDNTTHHRLSALGYASTTELNDFYSKIQDAFKNLDFGGSVNNAEVATGETTIVAPTPVTPVESTNDVQNASPYVFNVTVRSQWGLCGLDANGTKVDGFKSALSSSLTGVSLQNDAGVYQVYNGTEWISAKQAYAVASTKNISSVTNDEAMSYITEIVDLQNVRFFYDAVKSIPVTSTSTVDGVLTATTVDYSSGLPDDKSDTRHYLIKASDGALVQASSNYAVGYAVAFWAFGGGSLDMSGCTANFGIQALRSEGFAGIGTAGGSIPPDRGFTVAGIRRPVNVTKAQLLDVKNHKRVYLNQNISATTATTIVFSEPIDPAALLPFTLRPGTAIWVENITDGTTASAILGAVPLSADRKTITVETTNNNIDAIAEANLGLPYLRRFVDPRKETDQSYALWVTNSASGHRAPSRGDILRFAETPDPANANLLVPGVQLDPGATGGWNHVFSADKVLTQTLGDNPNESRVDPAPVTGSGSYYINLTLEDSYSPWVGNQTTDPASYRYPTGAVATFSGRNYRADANQLTTGAGILLPSDSNSVWSAGETFETLQLTSDAYISASPYSTASADPFKSFYTETSQYVRGIGTNSADYTLRNFIDYDSGTTTLGLETGNYGNPTYFDPAFNNSKRSIIRFLRLLGYGATDLATVLAPQVWSSRNLSVANFGIAISGSGYAVSAGNWPVEFNIESTISSVATSWTWCGYLNYTKGLPEYQGSSLPLRQRYDSISSSAWGGLVTASGLTESSDKVHVGTETVNESGRSLG
jgi:hypothetical protein